MKSSFELAIDISPEYDFSKDSLEQIGQNVWVKNQWPLVYFIQNAEKKIGYVGESTNALARIKNHLANPDRSVLTRISLIGSDKFNKSATLDIEYKLIQYISGEAVYKLQNKLQGLTHHNYYQQDLYKDLFKEIWEKLAAKRIVTKSLEEIENSVIFKYSPFKSLNNDQYDSVMDIIEAFNGGQHRTIFVKGSAGTGKTVVAAYLAKLLKSEFSEDEEYGEEEMRELKLVRSFRTKYPNAEIGLVVAMTSLRKTLKNLFAKTPGLKSSMVVSPSDTFEKKYDLLIVDEAHRLRQYKNINWRKTFLLNNEKLGLGTTGTELDWILANSKNQVFFYDSAQTIKPSDIDAHDFDKLLNDPKTKTVELKSQMRVKGGNDYITFVDDLLNVRLKKGAWYNTVKYDLLVFDSLHELYDQLRIKEEEFRLCRLVAGYAWPWLSDPKRKPKPAPDTIDIELDGLQFKWNSTLNDWVNSTNAFGEVGCIHTTQGYDLNYTGIIFGKEIRYNKSTGEIEIDPKNYFDQNGKKTIKDPEELKAYILNIYKTLMYRGIRGTFIYACNKDLNDYFKQHIQSFRKGFELRILSGEDVKPYVNAVPFYDIKAAAGSFSDLQATDHYEWVELPFGITAKEGYFVCQVVGESMNKKIPNGSYCLFRNDGGGTRDGQIVLVQSTAIQDADFGSGYTVKKYASKKIADADGWKHELITLKSLSNDPSYKDIVLSADDSQSLKVMGIFEQVISTGQ